MERITVNDRTVCVTPDRVHLRVRCVCVRREVGEW